jgi:hypothetical protein
VSLSAASTSSIPLQIDPTPRAPRFLVWLVLVLVSLFELYNNHHFAYVRACSCAQASHHTTRVGWETLSGGQNGAHELSVTCSRCWWIARSRPLVSDCDWRSCTCLLCSALAANFRSTPLSDFAGGSTASLKILDEPVYKSEHPLHGCWEATGTRG